jgi:hypothetical protein
MASRGRLATPDSYLRTHFSLLKIRIIGLAVLYQPDRRLVMYHPVAVSAASALAVKIPDDRDGCQPEDAVRDGLQSS